MGEREAEADPGAEGPDASSVSLAKVPLLGDILESTGDVDPHKLRAPGRGGSEEGR